MKLPYPKIANRKIASLLSLSFKILVSDVISGYVDSQGHRWKKSPPKTNAPRPSETTTSTSNLNQSSYNHPTQPDVIQSVPEGEPVQYAVVQPTPVQEALVTEKPLFPTQPVQDEELLAMTEKPVYQTKPSVDLEPVNDLVSDLNHLLDGLKEEEKEEKEEEEAENCVLKKNLEGCDIYLCSMIRSLLAVPFPDCYAVKSFYRMLDM